jgi:hypothetical protein
MTENLKNDTIAFAENCPFRIESFSLADHVLYSLKKGVHLKKKRFMEFVCRGEKHNELNTFIPDACLVRGQKERTFK